MRNKATSSFYDKITSQTTIRPTRQRFGFLFCMLYAIQKQKEKQRRIFQTRFAHTSY